MPPDSAVDVRDPERAALGRACDSARWNGASPSTFRSLVTGTDVETSGYRRVAHQIERREVTLEMVPASGSRASEIKQLPSHSATDPWAVDPATLPASSRRISTCPRCMGKKKVACSICSGHGRVRCNECGGRGKVSGQRGPKNCPTCRGRQDVSCPHCRKGQIECPPCAGVGRVQAWLEVHSTRSVQIKVHPRGPLTTLHTNLDDVADLSRQPLEYRIPLAHDSGWVDSLPEAPPPELAATLDPIAERVIGQRDQVFRTEIFRTRYATRTSQGVIEVSGNPPGVLPGSTWGPLRRRFLLALSSGVAMFVAASLVAGTYIERGAWFREHGNGGLMTLLGLIAAVVTGLAMAEAWLPRSVRRVSRLKVQSAGVAAAWLAIFVLWFVGGPALDRVQASLERGDLVEARQEIEALQVVGESSPELDSALQDLAEREQRAERARMLALDQRHLDEVNAAPTLEQAVASLGTDWEMDEMEAQAREAVRARAGIEVMRQYEAASHASLVRIATLIEPLDADTAARARSLSSLVRAGACRQASDFICATGALAQWQRQPVNEPAFTDAYDQLRVQTRDEMSAWMAGAARASRAEKDLQARKSAIQRVLDSADRYREFTGERPRLDVAALQRELARTERQIARDEQRAQAEERRRQVAEERAERRRQAAEEREERRRAAKERRQQRGYAPLLCNDGTFSPTCTCGGSRRGCCSHHGGVAGCSE